MPRVLLTAFEPYGQWRENASWLALVELTKQLPCQPQITTRLYPVDFAEVPKRLAADLEAGFDFAVHVGQAPGSSSLALEAIGLNIGGLADQPAEQWQPLVEQGPVALQCSLPLAQWVAELREQEIPARVSYHAGTYLCNATLYHSLYLSRQRNLPTRSLFIHVPLCISQVVGQTREVACLPVESTARGIRHILEQLGKLVPGQPLAGA